MEGGGVYMCVGDVIAGPNVFIAPVKRPETPIKAPNTLKKADLFVPPALDFLLIFNSGHLHRGSSGSASPANQTSSLERSHAGQ